MLVKECSVPGNLNRNPELGVCCAAVEVRQAARGGGKDYQLSLVSWLLRIISSPERSIAQKNIVAVRPAVSLSFCFSLGVSILPNRTELKKRKGREVK